MKKYIHLLNLLIIMAGFIIPTQATQVAVSDWSYTCVPNSNGLFNIRLILYRDCNGWAEFGTTGGCANATVNVQLRGADPGCNGTILSILTLTLRNVRDANPNPRCPDAKNICTNCGLVSGGTFVPAVERYEFGVDNVDLSLLNSSIPASCCNVRFSYQQCCRNSTITNGAANANFYTEMTINRCLSANPCNSSPVLPNDPFVSFCAAAPVMFNSGAIDNDLDSLVYSFVPSLISSGASVAYTPPFAFNRPFPWTGPANGNFPAGISINPRTGDIGFTPNGNSFVGVAAVQIQQWRWNPNLQIHQLVGTTRRDMQAWMRVCPTNSTPTLRTQPGLPGDTLAPRFNWGVCAGTTLCFDIIAADSNDTAPLIDTTFLSWNASLAPLGATFTPNYIPMQRTTEGPREDNFKFCWTPTLEMASSLPYFFTVRAQDGRCPSPGTVTRGFSVMVYNSNSAISHTACKSYISPSGKLFDSTGIYIDTIASTFGCDSIITINLTVNDFVDKALTTSGATISANNTFARYQWLDCNNGFAPIAGETNQTFTPTINGSYAVRLVQDSCIDTSACVAVSTVGILENTFNSRLAIYPNPTSGKVSIACDEELKTAHIMVRDITGKVVYQQQYSRIKNIQLNLEGESGIYLVELVDGNKKAVFRLIKE